MFEGALYVHIVRNTYTKKGKLFFIFLFLFLMTFKDDLIFLSLSFQDFRQRRQEKKGETSLSQFKSI